MYDTPKQFIQFVWIYIAKTSIDELPRESEYIRFIYT